MSPAWSPDGAVAGLCVVREPRVGGLRAAACAPASGARCRRAPASTARRPCRPTAEARAHAVGQRAATSTSTCSTWPRRQLTRITDDPAIDTEPAWSPDGRSLYFTSDRAGGPQIYRTRRWPAPRACSASRFGSAYNARPRVSPDGKRLALVTREDGDYRIARAGPGERHGARADARQPRRIAELRAQWRDADLRRPRAAGAARWRRCRSTAR